MYKINFLLSACFRQGSILSLTVPQPGLVPTGSCLHTAGQLCPLSQAACWQGWARASVPGEAGQELFQAMPTSGGKSGSEFSWDLSGGGDRCHTRAWLTKTAGLSVRNACPARENPSPGSKRMERGPAPQGCLARPGVAVLAARVPVQQGEVLLAPLGKELLLLILGQQPAVSEPAFPGQTGALSSLRNRRAKPRVPAQRGVVSSHGVAVEWRGSPADLTAPSPSALPAEPAPVLVWELGVCCTKLCPAVCLRVICSQQHPAVPMTPG